MIDTIIAFVWGAWFGGSVAILILALIKANE